MARLVDQGTATVKSAAKQKRLSLSRARQVGNSYCNCQFGSGPPRSDQKRANRGDFSGRRAGIAMIAVGPVRTSEAVEDCSVRPLFSLRFGGRRSLFAAALFHG